MVRPQRNCLNVCFRQTLTLSGNVLFSAHKSWPHLLCVLQENWQLGESCSPARDKNTFLGEFMGFPGNFLLPSPFQRLGTSFSLMISGNFWNAVNEIKATSPSPSVQGFSAQKGFWWKRGTMLCLGHRSWWLLEDQGYSSFLMPPQCSHRIVWLYLAERHMNL